MGSSGMIKIHGKELQFKTPIIGLLRQVAKIDKPVDWQKVMEDDAALAEAEKQWTEFCQLIINNPDDVPHLTDLTIDEYMEIREGFFGSAARVPKKNQNS